LHMSNDTQRDWTIYTSKDGLSNDSVKTIFKDTQGTVWFGTKHGLSQFNGTNWRTYTTSDGLAGNEINSIAEDINGSLWIGTSSGISQLDYIASISESIIKPRGKYFVKKIGNYPNPFNSETVIKFYVNKTGRLHISIYNILGQFITTLSNSFFQEGSNAIRWDGRNSQNNLVPSGTYIVFFKENFESLSHLIMFIK